MLVRNDAIGCLDHAYLKLEQHISKHGDGPIPPSLEFRFRSVEFTIDTIMPESTLSYNDALAIVPVFALKMGREGYQWWRARIISTEGAGHVGDAVIFGGFHFP